MIMRRGMSDFTTPDCTPGVPGCVPHWYCYVPGAATPDCIASVVTGTGELATAAGATVGQIAGNVATGAVGGLIGGFLKPSAACDPSDWWCQYGIWVMVAAGVGAAAIIFTGKGRRR